MKGLQKQLPRLLRGKSSTSEVNGELIASSISGGGFALLPGQVEGCFVYHAGTKLSEDGKFLTNGGRVIGVTAKGSDLQAALDKAYEGVAKIDFEGAHYRKDIGQRALKALS